MKKSKLKFLFVFLLLTTDLLTQNSYKREYATVIPGPEYEAGWLHKIFFGAHWRDLWTTPVKAEVLDLDNFEGGLTPLEKGGGLQTKSLKFEGRDGRIWKFRSINKDPRKVLPEELQESLVAEILQDQISTSNPLAPLVVAPFLDSVGILQSKPTLVLLPNDEKLGEFRSDFAGLLGMIEIHPDEPDEPGDAGFEEAEKVSGTLTLFDKLEKKREQKVNKTEFLKARLIDIYLGDWDRHTDQWRWARYEVNDEEIWYPIPRDRDQAFSKYDGLFPAIASYLTPQLTNFGYSYPQVEDITWNGRFLDRRFLTEIDKKSWDSVTAFVYSKLTDDLIVHAVNQLPPDYYEKAGKELITKLKFRRDKLKEFSDDYYEFVNRIVDIYCSEKDDYVEINRLSDDETEVSVYKLDKETGGKKGSPLFYKKFDNNLTCEFRINLNEGDDRVVVNGNVDKSPLVRIIGAGGEDELEDNSVVNGFFLSLTPFPAAENKTIMYDHGNKTRIKFNSGTLWDKEKFPEPEDELEKYEPKLRDRGSDWIYKPVLSYNSNDGFLIGSGFIYKSFNFRMDTLEYRLDFSGAYATNPKSYIVSFDGDFHSIVKGGMVNLNFYLSELSLIEYYGYGNETSYDEDLADDDYYQLNQELFTINPSIKYPVTKNFSASLGFSYHYSDISLRGDTLLTGFKQGTYGLNSLKLGGIHTSLEFDTRDVEDNPFTGFYLKMSGSYYPKMLDNKSSFTESGFDVRTYLSTNLVTDVTLALRAGGEKLFGSYPFFMAAFLGGGNNLRGFNRERFSGDASLFGQAELRIFLLETKLIIKGRMGLLGFTETGRVFTEHDISKKWHPAFGGGLWISYLNRQLNFNLAAAKSEESLLFYLLTSFMF